MIGWNVVVMDSLFLNQKKKIDAINKMIKIRDIIKKASDEGDCLKDAMLR